MCVNAHTHTNTHRACEQSSDEIDCDEVVIILSSNNKQNCAKVLKYELLHVFSF